MEDAIRVVIVLFLVITVAFMIIMFSKEILNNSRQQLNAFTASEATQDQVVQLNDVGKTDIINLAQACVAKHYKQEFGTTLCFVVTGTSFPSKAEYDGAKLDHDFALDASGVTGNYNALILSFDGENSKVKVTI